MIKKMKKRGALAISQIFILVVGIIAVSYAIGSGVGIVRGANEDVTFNYGNSIYTVENQNRISRPDGRWYDYNSETKQWVWHDSKVSPYKGVVNEETEGSQAALAIWNNLANNAIKEYNEKLEEETEPEKEVDKVEDKKVVEEKCNEKCISQKIYESGHCNTKVSGRDTCVGSDVEIGITSDCKGLQRCCCQLKPAVDKPKPAKVPLPTFPWPTIKADKDEVYQKLDKPITFTQDGKKIVIEEIKKTDEGVFVKVNDKDIPMNDEDIKALKKLEVLNEDSTINPDKIKTPPEKGKAPFGLEGAGGFVVGHLIKGAITAAAIWAGLEGVRAVLDSIGLPEAVIRIVDVAKWAGAFGWFAGEAVYGITKAAGAAKPLAWAIPAGVIVGLGVALAYGLLYKYRDQKTVVFECVPWQASTGGSHCEKCNKQGILPCSEYQCRSLGQACELLNKGTDEEKCVWVNRNDVDFPTIEAWEDVLLKDHIYDEQDTGIMPPDTGVKIINKTGDECIKAFTPLSFGITLNEPAKCKIDILRKDNFDGMDFYFSGGLSLYNHSYALSLPGSSALESEGIEIENEGEYGLYVRCQDANGNSNTANFVFKFCVEKGPDTTPPLIVGTTPLNNMPFGYNESSIENAEVYVNEPADCRWSHLDQSYDSMEEMNCFGGDDLIKDMNPQGLYTCKTTLTGLKDRVENKFYFRCKDQPKGVAESDRNVNVESYELSLIGTQPLVIDWVKPEGIIKDSTESVKVTLEAKTSAGYKEGEATCEFGETSDSIVDDQFTPFWTYQHSQDLWLDEDTYEYFIRCCDLGNNCDNETINFEVETDLAAPIVVRAYHEETYLKLVTNEQARCVYDTKYEEYPCDYSFDDGTPMTTIEDVNHYTNWNTQTTFYIICQDEYDNQPDPDECSKIIRPFAFY